MGRLGRGVLWCLVPVVGLLAYGTVRNNRALLNSLITAAILLLLAFLIVRGTAKKGVAMRLVGGIMVLVLVLAGSAFGVGCQGTVGDPVRYAALGDSYSSGEGAKASGQSYDTRLEYGSGAGSASDDPRCHRAPTAYPTRLRSSLGQTTLLFAACSGAKIGDVRDRHQYPTTFPQLDRLRKFVKQGPVDLVTISIGGNDLGFAKILAQCSKPRCQPGDPFGVEAELTADLARLPAELATLYGDIRKIAGAEVPLLVIGYPQFIGNGCGAALGLDGAERAFIRRSVHAANEAVRSSVILAGASYVDVEAAFARHLICSPAPYVHGVVTPGIDTLAVGDFLTGAYHPTPDGHECLADEILAQYPEPTTVAMGPIGTARGDQPAVGSASPCP